MARRPFRIQFEYFDGRAPYRYPLDPCNSHVALVNYRQIRDRLRTENENGVSRITLKLGNRIIDREDLKTYPSRWYVVKEKESNFFSQEGRPWGVVVPNSERRVGHYTTETEAKRIAAERNEESLERV